MRTLSLLSSLLVVAACGGDDSSPGVDGSVRLDGSRMDGGGTDGGGGTDAPVADGGGTDGGAPTDAGPADYCEMPSDCVWGEIDEDIQTATDCPCLLGCPTHVMSMTTRDRRQAQYDALCTPGMDGMGNPCPVDDCIKPPALDCVANRCVVPDGGT
jgi:hypothetical protein